VWPLAAAQQGVGADGCCAAGCAAGPAGQLRVPGKQGEEARHMDMCEGGCGHWLLRSRVWTMAAAAERCGGYLLR